jgi:hypothetical protein
VTTSSRNWGLFLQFMGVAGSIPFFKTINIEIKKDTKIQPMKLTIVGSILVE